MCRGKVGDVDGVGRGGYQQQSTEGKEAVPLLEVRIPNGAGLPVGYFFGGVRSTIDLGARPGAGGRWRGQKSRVPAVRLGHGRRARCPVPLTAK